MRRTLILLAVASLGCASLKVSGAPSPEAEAAPEVRELKKEPPPVLPPEP